MEDPKSLSLVAEFHKLFNHPILEEPSVPELERCKLRVALLREELDELEQALDQKDLIEVADALCDLQYVLAGAVLEFGLGKQFNDLFNEVQRSNMSKACKSQEELQDTLRHYADMGVECAYVEKSGHYLIYRIPDNKTLKSVHYSAADLGSILK
jgi:predicted HAD superfamily Cof-like phosphohydrolase